MLTVNITERVFKLECRATGKQGSAFTLEVDDKHYLVTADHLVPDAKGATLRLRTRSLDQELHLTKLPVLRPDADLAVYALPHPISTTFPIELSTHQTRLAEDAYLLGYPLGLHGRGFG